MLIESLAKLNSKSRSAVSAGVVFIVALTTYYWIVAPHVTQLYAVRQYDVVINDIIDKSNVLGSAVVVKRKKIEQLRQQFGQLQDSLFMPDKAKEFFSDLQVISEQAGCAVSSLNLVSGKQKTEEAQSENTSGIVTQSAMLSVIGTYGDVVTLVEKLQSRPQKVWLDSFKMANLDDNSGQIRCDITITICTIQDKEAISHEEAKT